MNRDILVIGDCHVEETQDLSRFSLLSKHIVATKPDDIVIIGDFLTLNALSAWDRDKRKKMEGKRYQKEIEAGNKALDLLMADMLKLQKKQRKNKEKQYKPNLIFIEGNHEDRLTRYLDYDPTFEGAIGVEKDLRLKERGWKWVDYRDYHYINEIGFTHIPHNTVSPIAGKYHIHRATDCTVKSVVYGHTHKLETACKHVEGMDHLQQVLSVGCFFQEHEEYVKGRVTHYWKGVVTLHSYKPNRFDIDTMSLGAMRRKYA